MMYNPELRKSEIIKKKQLISLKDIYSRSCGRFRWSIPLDEVIIENIGDGPLYIHKQSTIKKLTLNDRVELIKSDVSQIYTLYSMHKNGILSCKTRKKENHRQKETTINSDIEADDRCESEKPSECTDSYWIHTKRERGSYPEHSENGGKWLIFIKSQDVDEVWEKIKVATKRGDLGEYAKVSTSRRNKKSDDLETKVICVYTYDWTDKNDVRRIRDALRQIGITSKIPYKADKDTRSGIYSNTVNSRISKYYE